VREESEVEEAFDSATREGFEGYSTTFGYGVINPTQALLAEIPSVSSNPLGSLSQWIDLYRASAEVEVDPGEIVSPIKALTPFTAFEEPAPSLPWYADISNWLPLAGYAGLGLLATFLYFAFRSPGPSPNRVKRK